MISQKSQLPHIHVLAKKLEADIRGKGLSVGDRYLTTEGASRMLGVRKAMASKALRHLAEQQIVLSRPGAGTFIGPGLEKNQRSEVQTVYVLLPAGDPSATDWAYQPFIAGIRSSLPQVNVQFTFIPENDPLPYVQQLINSSRESGQFAGVVSVSSPPEVYRYLSDLHLPAVVSGSVYSSELPLSSVDLDNRRSGRLLTQYMIDRGHRRLALLLTGAGRPGNNDFIDGVSDALTTAGLAPNALIQRLVHYDIEALRVMAKELLQSADRPTAIVTRGSVQVDAVASVASSLGLLVPDDLEIVFDDSGELTHLSNTRLYPRMESKLPFVERAAMIGKLLKEMSDGVSSPPRRVVIPMEFHEPERPPKQTKVD